MVSLITGVFMSGVRKERHCLEGGANQVVSITWLFVISVIFNDMSIQSSPFKIVEPFEKSALTGCSIEVVSPFLLSFVAPIKGLTAMKKVLKSWMGSVSSGISIFGKSIFPFGSNDIK